MAKESKLARSSGAGEDRLSSLPDEILINNILSILPMREAQRTSILARSWRYLWPYVPCLDLDGSQKVLQFPRRRTDDLLHQESATKYSEWVDRVIDAYRGTTALRHFRVIFRLGSSFTHKIDSWLEFSLRQGVEVLELDCCDTFYCPGYWPYSLRLSIKPSRFPNTRLLKSLTLRGLNISNDSLKDLLLACEFLETLHLSHLRDLTHVNVTGPVSRLKHIDIGRSKQLAKITILAPTPDLVSFTYHYVVRNRVHIKHAPRLVDLPMVLEPNYQFQNITLHPLFRYLSQLEALKLVLFVFHLSGNRDTVFDEYPVLDRLKHLKLGQINRVIKGRTARWVASLIQKAPLLQHLTLELGVRGWMSRDEPASLREELDKMHLQLPPVIEIGGFEGRMEDCEVVLHLIKDSPSLEKLIIDCRDPYRRGCTFAPYTRSAKTVNKWKRLINEVIVPQLPSKAKLVII